MHRAAPCILAFAIALLATPGPSRATDSELPEDPDCLTVRGEAWLQAYGYRHVVIVENQCRRVATCEVWTSADPTPHHRLVVDPGHTGSVVTRIGSPAREFEARHSCELD